MAAGGNVELVWGELLNYLSPSALQFLGMNRTHLMFFFHSQLTNVSILLLKGTLSSLEKLRQNQWVFYRLREWFLGEFIGESKILRRFLVPHYNAGAKFLGMIVF